MIFYEIYIFRIRWFPAHCRDRPVCYFSICEFVYFVGISRFCFKTIYLKLTIKTAVSAQIVLYYGEISVKRVMNHINNVNDERQHATDKINTVLHFTVFTPMLILCCDPNISQDSEDICLHQQTPDFPSLNYLSWRHSHIYDFSCVGETGLPESS